MSDCPECNARKMEQALREQDYDKLFQVMRDMTMADVKRFRRDTTQEVKPLLKESA